MKKRIVSLLLVLGLMPAAYAADLQTQLPSNKSAQGCAAYGGAVRFDLPENVSGGPVGMECVSGRAGGTAAPGPSVTLKRTSDHQKYMDGYEDGTFRPNAPLTRAELAQMLYAVIEERPEPLMSFPDVPETAWYCQAAGTLGALRVMGGGLFLPEQPVTRAECAAALVRALGCETDLEGPQVSFADVPETYWAGAEISQAAAYGLFAGDEMGNFSPDSPLTRAEAAAVFNRLLGRRADEAELSSRRDLRMFPDVPADFWAYGEIMEAAVSHVGVPQEDGRETWEAVAAEKTVLTDGLHVIDGSVYRVKDGMFLYGTSDGYLTYDAGGRAVCAASPVKPILQNPQLRNGCEVTSLAMVMASAGCPVDKMVLYQDYLPKAGFYYQGSVRYGPDPEEYYVGDAAARSGGWYCFEGPIIQAGNAWLAGCGSGLRAVSVTGLSQEELDAYAKAGVPVIVWVTLSFGAPRLSAAAWRLADGTVYRPYSNLHCVVLTGLSGERYQVADPINGMHTVSRSAFWSCFSAMGSRAVVVA